MLLVVYYTITVPIEFGFSKSPFDNIFVEIIFNLFFIIDIALNFFTAFKNGFTLVTDLKSIANK